MTEVVREMKQLQKLGRTDLMILLGQLEDHLDQAEKENAGLRTEIGGLQEKNGKLRQERDDYAQKNNQLVEVLRAVNKRLLEREETPAGWREMENLARQLREATRQLKEQAEALKKLRETGGVSGAAQKEAVALAKRLQKVNVEMLESMQAAIDRAHEGYEAVLAAPPEGEGQEQGERVQTRAAQEERKVVLTPDQANRLLKVLRRLEQLRGCAPAQAAEQGGIGNG